MKNKKCRLCKKEYQPRNSLQKVCSPTCAIKLVEIDKEKKAKKHQAEETKRVRRKLKELDKNSRSKALKAAQKAFNAFIRERDSNKPCICCGRFTDDSGLVTGSRWDAGHYRSTGSAPELRFNEDNCHRQMVYCNRNLSGNAVMYRKGLIERIGLERVEELEREHQPKKYSVDDLWNIEAEYKRKLKELKND